MTTDAQYRIERDSMGEVRVPVGAKWRAQTQRAVHNFPISGRPLERAQISALGQIKAAAAKVNADLGVSEGESQYQPTERKWFHAAQAPPWRSRT